MAHFKRNKLSQSLSSSFEQKLRWSSNVQVKCVLKCFEKQEFRASVICSLVPKRFPKH